MESCVLCNGGLAIVLVKSTCDSLPSSVPLTACNAPLVEENSVKLPEISTRSTGVGASSRDKRDESCVSCIGGLAFLSPFDRMQPPVCEGKVCQVA